MYVQYTGVSVHIVVKDGGAGQSCAVANGLMLKEVLRTISR